MIVTYQLSLEAVEGTSFWKIVDISVVEEPDHLSQQLEQTRSIVGPHLPGPEPSREPVVGGSSVIKVEVTKVGEGVEEVNYPYELYEHPITKKKYMFLPGT